MEKGTIVEYIDRQRMVCAVVMAPVKAGDKRIHLYTEHDQEVELPGRRITHSGGRLDTGLGRRQLSGALKETVARRNALVERIDIPSLWNRLNPQAQWISLATMRTLCFAEQATVDHESAVVRAMFEDSLYFKFDHNRFFPHSLQQIKVIKARKEKEERKKRTIQEGSEWLQRAMKGGAKALSDNEREYVGLLKDYYVFDQEAEEKALTREMLARAGGISREKIFSILVRLGVWGAHENIDLIRYGISTSWSPEITSHAEVINRASAGLAGGSDRVDLTGLSLFTIDGSTTADFDDALSIEIQDDGECRIGVHISDVAQCVKRNDPLDREAINRGSSIYTADQKIPMLPPVLSEDACSLKAGEVRPAISILMRFSHFADLLDYEIVASIVRVEHHLSYNEADRRIEQDERLKKLNGLTAMLRRKRIQAGAVQINIPDLFIQFIDKDRVVIKRTEEISPSRIMVAELMITANRLFAHFLSEHHVPAAFRSQTEPKQRLIKKTGGSGTLFQNWVQRKMITRVVLSSQADHHTGLGLEQYTTATSPIRKYLDLMAQRQIRSILGLETPYTSKEVQGIIQTLGPTLSNVARIQQARQRYWVLKFLESKIGDKEEAIVLDGFADDYSVLLPDYLLECRLPKAAGTNIKPKDLIQVTIQHVNARNNIISIFFG